MNQESVTKSLTAPFYVTFTFLHLGFHVFEIASHSDYRGQNRTFHGDVFNSSDFLHLNTSDAAFYTLSGNLLFCISFLLINYQ